MAKKNIILGVTASIAAYKACDIIRLLREEKFSVKVVMTEDAKEFITPLALSTLSNGKVYLRMFASQEAWDIEHISLAEWADLILIAPATADIIARIACGLCNDLLSSVACAAKAPVLICPAMNDNMYLNKITQKNIGELKKTGYRFLGPVRGRLATGKVAIGHLAKAEDIAGEARRILRG